MDSIDYLRSESGIELDNDEVVDVTVLSDGLMAPGPRLKKSPRTALVCATHADGSMGRTGSCRGMVK